MKKVILFSAILSVLAFGDNLYQLNVKNMNCCGCAKNIEKAAKTFKGFKAMSKDFDTKDVNLTYEKQVDINEVVAAIKEAGYNAVIK